MCPPILLIRVGGNIRLYLVGVGQAVSAVKHLYHGYQLRNRFVIQTQPLHGGAVGMDSVDAIIGN